MKYNYLILIITLFTFNCIYAQPGSAIWKTRILQVTYVRGTTPATNITPSQRFHFDKLITVKAKVANRPERDITLFLNTTDGYMGILPGGGNIIFPELPEFNFFVLGVNGEAYRYYNSVVKRDVIERRVSTGNTELFRYEFQNTPGSIVLEKRGEPRNYYDGQVRGATCYMYEGGTTKLFLYGNNYPQRLHVTRYFGNFGIGYLQTTEGTYLVFERQDFEDYYKIKSIETEFASLPAFDYKIDENEYFTRRTAELEKSRIKIAKEEAELGRGNVDCLSEKTYYLDWKKRNLQQQQEYLRMSQSGNFIQNREAQQGMVGSMDPLLIIQEAIYVARINLCNDQTELSRGPSNVSALASRISCLIAQIGELQITESALLAIDRRFASSPGQAFGEKSKYLMQHVPGGCN